MLGDDEQQLHLPWRRPISDGSVCRGGEGAARRDSCKMLRAAMPLSYHAYRRKLELLLLLRLESGVLCLRVYKGS